MAAEYGAAEQEEKPLTTLQARRARIKAIVRPRIVAFGVLVLFIFKLFRFMHGILPTRARGIVQYWTWRMQWVFVRSGGYRVVAEQPSTPKIPADYKPRAEVGPKWKISEEQVKFFFDRGFLAPLKLFEPDEMADILRPRWVPLPSRGRQ